MLFLRNYVIIFMSTGLHLLQVIIKCLHYSRDPMPLEHCAIHPPNNGNQVLSCL